MSSIFTNYNYPSFSEISSQLSNSFKNTLKIYPIENKNKIFCVITRKVGNLTIHTDDSHISYPSWLIRWYAPIIEGDLTKRLLELTDDDDLVPYSEELRKSGFARYKINNKYYALITDQNISFDLGFTIYIKDGSKSTNIVFIPTIFYLGRDFSYRYSNKFPHFPLNDVYDNLYETVWSIIKTFKLH